MRATGDLKLAELFARHANISTTADIYTHLDHADLIRGMRLAGERLGEGVISGKTPSSRQD